MILEKLGIIFIMLIVVAIIIGVIYLVDYIRSMENRIWNLEFRNEKEDRAKWADFSKKVFQKEDSRPKV